MCICVCHAFLILGYFLDKVTLCARFKSNICRSDLNEPKDRCRRKDKQKTLLQRQKWKIESRVGNERKNNSPHSIDEGKNTSLVDVSLRSANACHWIGAACWMENISFFISSKFFQHFNLGSHFEFDSFTFNSFTALRRETERESEKKNRVRVYDSDVIVHNWKKFAYS